MPLGWECRAKLIKQVPLNPTQKRGPTCGEMNYPGPGNYEQPEIFCGPGFSKIKRAPAYTFGHITPIVQGKMAAKPNAPLFNIQGFTRKGRHQVPGGTPGLHIQPPREKAPRPGPNTYFPQKHIGIPQPPAYSMRIGRKPYHEPWNMWTPSPNMYWPPLPGKKEPAYSLKGRPPPPRQHMVPSIGQYNANFDYCAKNPPQYSIGPPFRTQTRFKSPAPNEYCYKLFMANKRTAPAPTFGIKHSPYIGTQKAYLRNSDLQVTS